MKSTTVRELRTNWSEVLSWVAKGEEVKVTRRGKAVAKVVPVASPSPVEVAWNKSAALHRKPWSVTLTAEQSAAVLTEF